MIFSNLILPRAIAFLSVLLLPATIRWYEFIELKLLSSWSDFLWGLNSDFIASLLVYFLIFFFRSLWFTALILILWFVFNYANFEFVVSMNRMGSYRDLHYFLDAEFVTGSAMHISSLAILIVSIALNLMIALIKYQQIPVLDGQYKRAHLSIILLSFSLMFLFASTVRANIAQNTWVRYNVVHKNIMDLYARFEYDWLSRDDKVNVSDKINRLNQIDLSGKKLFKNGQNKKQNVLLIILEGIPGTYISKNTDFLKVHSPITMRHLSQQASQAMSIPNFAAHTQQTIRGLYAILCGDYPKLTGTTPKAYEVLNLQQEIECLPRVLTKNGYQTIYMQGAGLEFMAKNKFMPKIGFQKVYGRSFFKKRYVDFRWGIDDKAFFEQAADYIETLDQSSPWFLTLLTVSGHHPYGVPDSLLSQYSSRKEASIHYADEAVANFIDGLRQSGVDKNTLIIVTSDESHGVVDFPLAKYWGLGLVMSPQKLPNINPDFFSQADFPVSILDYLTIDIPNNFIGRSFFRSYDVPRTILFGGEGLIYEVEKGKPFWLCDLPNRNCASYWPNSENLFGNTYDAPMDLSYVKSQKIRKVVRTLDKSIVENQTRVIYDLSNEKTLPVVKDKWTMLSGGQYFSVVKESYVTVHFTLNTNSHHKDAEFEIVYKVFDQNGFLTTKVFSQEGVKSHETLAVSLAFVVPEATRSISSNIEVRSRNGDGDVLLEQYIIRVEELNEEKIKNQSINKGEFELQHLSLVETQGEG